MSFPILFFDSAHQRQNCVGGGTVGTIPSENSAASNCFAFHASSRSASGTDAPGFTATGFDGSGAFVGAIGVAEVVPKPPLFAAEVTSPNGLDDGAAALVSPPPNALDVVLVPNGELFAVEVVVPNGFDAGAPPKPPESGSTPPVNAAGVLAGAGGSRWKPNPDVELVPKPDDGAPNGEGDDVPPPSAEGVPNVVDAEGPPPNGEADGAPNGLAVGVVPNGLAVTGEVPNADGEPKAVDVLVVAEPPPPNGLLDAVPNGLDLAGALNGLEVAGAPNGLDVAGDGATNGLDTAEAPNGLDVAEAGAPNRLDVAGAPKGLDVAGAFTWCGLANGFEANGDAAGAAGVAVTAPNGLLEGTPPKGEDVDAGAVPKPPPPNGLAIAAPGCAPNADPPGAGSGSPAKSRSADYR